MLRSVQLQPKKMMMSNLNVGPGGAMDRMSRQEKDEEHSGYNSNRRHQSPHHTVAHDHGSQ